MFQFNWNNKRPYNNTTTFYNETTGGDSGSGFYLYDNVKKRMGYAWYSVWDSKRWYKCLVSF